MAVTSSAPRLAVDSDVGALERVVLHRPGAELARITPATAGEFLFDGPVDPAAAGRDHDELADALRSAGAEVLYAQDLLARRVADPAERDALLERLCHDDDARAGLAALAPDALAAALVHGVAGPDGWAVRPVPNLLFTRDLFAVLGDGVAVSRMRRAPRRAERCVADALLAAQGAEPGWTAPGVAVEGGDVLALGDGVVVIGTGERTTAEGAAALAGRLLGTGTAREVVSAVMPPGGPFHLDLALTLVDHDTVLCDLPVVEAAEAVRHRPGDAAPERSGDVLATLSSVLGRRLRVVPALGGDHDRAWDHGANVVAVAPGRVVAYADNRSTNRRLARAGVEVLEVPGALLGRGRGGPRCLTAPLSRRPA